MECDICERSIEQVLHFFCAACARNAAYPVRIQYAQILLENGSLSAQVEDAVSPTKLPEDHQNSLHPSSNRTVWLSELRNVQIGEVKRKIDQLKAGKQRSQDEISELQAQIQELKARISTKRAAMTKIKSEVPSRWQKELTNARPAFTRALWSLAQLKQKSATNRALLCREAASLMRMRQRRRQRDGSGRDQYSIANLTLPDLREISNVRCADLSAVLGSVAHLTLLVAFYLGIRLPAELIAPGKDRPMPMINTPFASYRGNASEISRSTTLISMATSSSASRTETTTVFRPRPLFVGSDNREERLQNFQKQEPQAFNLFVEGLALLAWDIAWLCRSQGFTEGTNSWEDICNVGKNLHQLLVASMQMPSITKLQSERMQRKNSLQSKKPSSPVDERLGEVTGKLGQYSDLSAADAGCATAQNDIQRSWNYLSWQAIATSLRKTLLTEITSAEWELLQDQEWDDGTEQFDEAILVKPRTLDNTQFDESRNILTAKSRNEGEAKSSVKLTGTSGWTKLKNRDRT